MSEALARLTLKTVCLDGGFGGVSELTQAEFAGVLARLDPLSSQYGYAKYLENYTNPPKVKKETEEKYNYRQNSAFATLWLSVSGIAEKLLGDWELSNQIAYAVCVEAIEPNTCKACDGNGRKKSKKVVGYDTCKVCHGVGFKGKTDHARAQLMGRDRKVYKKYEQPYDTILTLLYNSDEKIRRKINNELKKESTTY